MIRARWQQLTILGAVLVIPGTVRIGGNAAGLEAAFTKLGLGICILIGGGGSMGKKVCAGTNGGVSKTPQGSCTPETMEFPLLKLSPLVETLEHVGYVGLMFTEFMG